MAHLADYGLLQLHGEVGIDIAWAMARAHAIKKCRSGFSRDRVYG
ncbi:hypothetical protein [Xanthomonas translucens]|nr:hypothetical protein [Xanthomonas translucens]MCS3358328.1 hypothetical protein [Xanthomonas translucens pv. translucens]MCS3371861.1 hypothetical protein [Xanthomonas translucens pv. translucens]MCT8274133.1 hypothetical protein [Xanthomonas translucens pv. translucens]MCT8278045.1 hypothetical protein [Xanthomonas translucens pv. translucens]MCT8284381.1 hypothetical protein [Xanthomonas translucens pv. translucens]